MQNNELTRQKMFSLIDQWQQSDISQKRFCEQNNIQYSVFHYWYKRYRIQNQDPEASKQFIKLAVSPLTGSGYAELVLPDGKRLLFHQPVTSDYLKTLIS
jgi:hypothetical protein